MTIRLHSTKGVNPHLTECVRCGREIGIILLGVHDHKYTCDKCKCVHYGGYSSTCAHCKTKSTFTKKEIGDSEKIPGGLCDSCEAKQKACDEEVEAGGVYIRCEDCGMQGALGAEHPLSAEVRAKGAMGLTLTKDECPECARLAQEATVNAG